MASRAEQKRIEKGLCPRCGEDAAPYRLCYLCRQRQRVSRALDRMARTGSLEVRRDERGRKVFKKTGQRPDTRWATLVVPPDDDRRFRPRIAGIPVEVEESILLLFERMDRPCSVDEVVQAWGRLRTRRRRGNLVADLRALIEAEQRRERRAAKRLSTSKHTQP
jgi:hypothetical protein